MTQLSCCTRCISQNRAALLAQRNSVGSTWKSKRPSFSNIILHPISAGGVTFLGSLSSCMGALYPAWPRNAVDHQRAGREAASCRNRCKSKMPKQKKGTTFFLFAITRFLLLYTHHPFGHAHPLSFTLCFFWLIQGKKNTCERGAICHSLPLKDLLLSVYPPLHQPEVVRKNLASSSSPTLLVLAQSEVSKDKNEERLEITGLK